MPNSWLVRTALGQWILAGDYGVSQSILKFGTFDYPDNLRDVGMVAGYIPEGGVVVDAGACLGETTAIYSQIVGASGLVFACEPHPVSYQALAKNTARFTNVRALNVGLGDREDTLTFSMVGTNIGASFLGKHGNFPDAPNAVFPTSDVKVTTLDTLLADVPHVDFIHLDAEGMETKILAGATTIIQRDHPVLLIEVTDEWLKRYGSSSEALLRQITAFGYPTLQRLQPNPAQYDVLAIPAQQMPQMAKEGVYAGQV